MGYIIHNDRANRGYVSPNYVYVPTCALILEYTILDIDRLKIHQCQKPIASIRFLT